jgi:hypothetical protein
VGQVSNLPRLSAVGQIGNLHHKFSFKPGVAHCDVNGSSESQPRRNEDHEDILLIFLRFFVSSFLRFFVVDFDSFYTV